MKVLLAFGTREVGENWDKVGDLGIGSNFLKKRPGVFDVVGNDPNGHFSDYIGKFHQLDRTRNHGKCMYERLREVAGDYDVVLIRNPFIGFATYVNRLADELTDVKWVVTHHAPPDSAVTSEYKFRSRETYLEYLRKWNVYSVFASHSFRERFLHHFPDLKKSSLKRLRVIHNGIMFDGKIPKQQSLSAKK